MSQQHPAVLSSSQENSNALLNTKQTLGDNKVIRRALNEVGVNTKGIRKDNGYKTNSTSLKSDNQLKRTIYHDSDSDSANDEDSEDQHVSKKQKQINKIRSNDPKSQESKNLGSNNITMVVEYTADIFSHLLKRELETTTEFNYVIDKSSSFYLRPSMRSILVDWLIEVHYKFQLLPETLYLSINLMDRYLSKNKVSLSKLQLVTITSLLIAAKFEEVNLPKLSNYTYITDNAYTKDEVKDAEFQILNCLNYDIGWPNPMNFIRRISKIDNYNHETRSLSKLFLEFSMCCPCFINIQPSLLSAISMYCSMKLCYGNDDQWNNTKEYYGEIYKTIYENLEFDELCGKLINEISEPSTQLNALIYKYKKIGLWDKVKKWCDEQSSK